ncbi:MAG: M1 family aminopeptidase [Candidatus Ventricola sp.]
MRIRRILACALLAAAAVCGAVVIGGMPGKEPPVQERAFSGERDIVRARLNYDAGLRTLRGTQEMTITNRTGSAMEEIVLRLPMNAQDENAVAVSNVQVNGEKAAYALNEDDPTVLRVAHSFLPGETLEITFTLMIRHPRTTGTAVVTLPQLAMPEDGAWRIDAYDELVDVSYAQAFDCAVWLEDELRLCMEGARDASFAIRCGGKTRTRTAGSVSVSVYVRPDGDLGMVHSCVKEALSSLEAIGLTYPFDRLTVVDMETARADGAVYSGLIALDADTDRETLRRRLTRLIAREMFGILIENDPWNAPWLSETLASGAELLAYRKLKGTAAYEERLYGEIELSTRLTRPYGVTVGAGTAHFGGDAEMTQVLRDQGAAMLLGMEQAMGEETFLAALQAYIGKSAGGTATQKDLAAALREASGSSWDGYLTDGLTF